MDQTYEEVAQKCGNPKKKLKKEQKEQNNEGWIVVQSKNTDLSISICDFSRVNRYYSHRSIQSYIRYLLAQSVPNPMWLSIKRQSLIEQILYIDLQIESTLFESMITKKELEFLGQIVNQTNTAHFKYNSKIFREDLWECLLGCQTQKSVEDLQNQKGINELPPKLSEQLMKKYEKYVLTPQELKSHLYPTKEFPIYADFYQLKNTSSNSPELKNKILIIDCEMVLSSAGFELARTTIMNFQGENIFDQLFKPQVPIINYNTEYSGITQQMLENVTNTLENCLYPFLETHVGNDTILVGHSLQNDLRAMKLIYNKVIDSSVLFMRKNGTKFKLKSLADKILNRKIQVGEHCSEEDCLATLHLIRAKIENDEEVKKKDFTVLKQIEEAKKSVAIVDYAIDYEMKAFQGNHYQKTEMLEKSGNLFKVVRKYLKRDVAIPSLILTRIEKREEVEWEDYYRQFDDSFRDLHQQIPKKTAVIVNCQVNPKITLVVAGKPLKLSANIRNPCYFIAV